MGKFEFADMAKMDPIGLKQKIRHRADERAETAMALRAEENSRSSGHPQYGFWRPLAPH
jgi:hypothetical protein